MKREFTCIVCPNGCRLHTEVENGAVTSVSYTHLRAHET